MREGGGVQKLHEGATDRVLQRNGLYCGVAVTFLRVLPIINQVARGSPVGRQCNKGNTDS
jgi:hypothetical protein